MVKDRIATLQSKLNIAEVARFEVETVLTREKSLHEAIFARLYSQLDNTNILLEVREKELEATIKEKELAMRQANEAQ